MATANIVDRVETELSADADTEESLPGSVEPRGAAPAVSARVQIRCECCCQQRRVPSGNPEREVDFVSGLAESSGRCNLRGSQRLRRRGHLSSKRPEFLLVVVDACAGRQSWLLSRLLTPPPSHDSLHWRGWSGCSLSHSASSVHSIRIQQKHLAYDSEIRFSLLVFSVLDGLLLGSAFARLALPSEPFAPLLPAVVAFAYFYAAPSHNTARVNQLLAGLVPAVLAVFTLDYATVQITTSFFALISLYAFSAFAILQYQYKSPHNAPYVYQLACLVAFLSSKALVYSILGHGTLERAKIK